MDALENLHYKIATEEWEFEQIHALNYETFAEEIPQHQQNQQRRLIDKFHAENTYVICLKNKMLIGMMAVRGQRPFSLDAKIENLDAYLPPAQAPCEFRLFAIRQAYRNTRVAREILLRIIKIGLERGYDVAVISAAVRQLKLYKNLGFIPFGPVIGSAEAPYQPMYSVQEIIYERFPILKTNAMSLLTQSKTVLLQPGPVPIHPSVQAQFKQPAVSHRSPTFRQMLQELKASLCALTGAARVEITMGSGTLGNDVVAGQLAQLSGKGLILVNGEFGERLLDHAARWQLSHQALRYPWGQSFPLDEAEKVLKEHRDITWLWLVHCETSTGELNDLPAIRELVRRYSIKLAVDCISSFGTVPVDLTDVFLATAVSGKGLGSYPGLSILFHDAALPAVVRPLPRYLDLNYYLKQNSVPFTLSSHQVSALLAGVKRVNDRVNSPQISELTVWLIEELKKLGCTVVVEGIKRNPAIITLAVPAICSSEMLGTRLQAAGYYTNYQSEYLVQKNWLQMCFFGDHYTQPELQCLVDLFVEAFGDNPQPAVNLQHGHEIEHELAD